MITLTKLLERQIATSELRNRLGKSVLLPGSYVDKEGVAFGPCLMISRECGSGSSLLATTIGERLGWNVFDSQIVDEIATVAHIQRQLVNSVDEHTYSLWERTWRELLLEDLPDKKYLHHLRQVILTLGHQGNVVLVGRGAQFFLPPQCGLRLRLVAPWEIRAQRVAEEKKISILEARDKIEQKDSERAAFIRKIFNKDITSPANHDLVIHTGEIRIESAVEIVLVAIQEKLGISVAQSLRRAAA